MPREVEPLLEEEAMEKASLRWRGLGTTEAEVRLEAAAATAAKPEGVMVCSEVALCRLAASRAMGGAVWKWDGMGLLVLPVSSIVAGCCGEEL